MKNATMIMFVFAATINVYAQEVRFQSTSFTSENNIEEKCFYPIFENDLKVSEKKTAKLDQLRSLDLYSTKKNSENIQSRVCPKLVSSSPGLYVITNPKDRSQAAFSENFCQGRHPLKKDGDQKLKKEAKFKISLGYTKAPSSVLYYYLSNALHTDLAVAPAVFRTVDQNFHRQQTAAGLAKLKQLGAPSTSAIYQAWEWLNGIYSQSPKSSPRKDFYFDDQRIYGVLVQKPDAVQWVAPAKGPGVSTLNDSFDGYKAVLHINQLQSHYSTSAKLMQATSEARGMADMMLMDYILGQKDRYGAYGNIHYKLMWKKTVDHKIESEEATLNDRETDVDAREKSEMTKQGYVLVKKIALLDNDGGLSKDSENKNKALDILSKFKHINANTYKGLKSLVETLLQVAMKNVFTKSFMISEAQYDQLAANATTAWKTLKSRCESGHMKLDLDMQVQLGLEQESKDCL